MTDFQQSALDAINTLGACVQYALVLGAVLMGALLVKALW